MITGLGVSAAIALLLLAARGLAASTDLIRRRFTGRSRYPESWLALDEELERTATLYDGYRQGAAAMRAVHAIARWARSRPQVLQIATETCATLGTSSFIELSNRHILRFDEPATLDPLDPWHETDRPELVLVGTTAWLVGARRAGDTVEADFQLTDRTITLRCSGAAVLR